MKMELMSCWETEKGHWDDDRGKFVERTVTKSERVIEMEISKQPDSGRILLAFHGGPTGHESYYLEDLLTTLAAGKSKSEKFYICAGTINRWPACWVPWEVVRKFMLRYVAGTLGSA